MSLWIIVLVASINSEQYSVYVLQKNSASELSSPLTFKQASVCQSYLRERYDTNEDSYTKDGDWSKELIKISENEISLKYSSDKNSLQVKHQFWCSQLAGFAIEK